MCEVPHRAARQAAQRAWVKSVHCKGARRLPLCPQPSQLRLCQTGLLGAHPCCSSAGAEGKPSTQTVPPGSRKAGRLSQSTRPPLGGLVSRSQPFLAVEEVSKNHVSGLFSSSVLKAEQQHALWLSLCCQ